MDSTQGVQIVGKSLNEADSTGELTMQIPVSQIGMLQDKLGLNNTVGSWANNYQLGERYGLRPDSQALSMPNTRTEEIDLAKDLYRSEPIVANVIDLMVDFAITKMENRCEDLASKKYFDTVCKYGDVDSLHRYIYKEYFLSSDVFMLRTDKKEVDYGPDKGKTYFTWTVLNPKYVKVEGSLIFDSASIGIVPNEEIRKLTKEKSKYNRKLTKLPRELRDAAINDGVYYPPEYKVSRIARKKQPYERYATPFLTRVFEPVLIKRRMREADVALAETVKSVLVTFTIGDKEFPATQGQLDALGNLLQTPNKSMELVWNHTLKVEYHFPDASLFEGTKYDEVDKDILQGLGIPPVLIDGEGGTFATAFTSLLSVIQRLEAVQEQVGRWQEEEYRRIAKAENLTFKQLPSVYFRPLNLRDEKVYGAFLLEMYDRGLLSLETLMNLTDFDLGVEARNREAENKAKMGMLFKPRKVAPDKPAGPQPKTGRPNNDATDPGQYAPRSQTPKTRTGPPKTKPKVQPK
jgi:hypothetical protein